MAITRADPFPQSPYYAPTVARMPCYAGLSPAAKNALDAMSRDESFAGNADCSILNLIDALIAGNDAKRVLQLGTLIGFSTVILSSSLARVKAACGADVRLDTVDIDVEKHRRARDYLTRAGLEGIVRFLDGGSTAPDTLEQLRGETYDVVFVDASHNYVHTGREIDAYWPKVRPGGYMLFHDASEHARVYDPKGEGGVRRALDEWLRSPPPDLHARLLLEPPYWANPCGVFWAVKAA
jgi:predicted O-methyltransferase YrrM